MTSYQKAGFGTKAWSYGKKLWLSFGEGCIWNVPKLEGKPMKVWETISINLIQFDDI